VQLKTALLEPPVSQRPLPDTDDHAPRSRRSDSHDGAVGELIRGRLFDGWRWWESGDHGGTVALPGVPILAHLDLDAFFAAVEELEEPSLRRVPLVVGGNPQGRGVVATANYVARRFGIHSAMSSAEALRRCPEVVFVRPRHALYRQYSQAVWGAIREVVPRVEQVGIDEGYLDLGTVVPVFTGARAVAEAIQTSVRAATSLSCSLGVSTSKVVCKVASDRRKPGGITVVPPGKEARFLAPFPVRALPGVGPKAEQRLAAAGVKTVGALAALSDSELRAVLQGSIGRLLRDRALGIDPRDLELETERVSISVEETFERDISDRTLLHAEVMRLSDELSLRMQRSGVSGRTVTAKLRYADFSIRSRSTTLPAPVDEADRIGDLACGLLDRGLRDRPGALRLVGVGVSGLTEYRQLTFDP
jgi:DNA polymerase-4